MMHGQKNIKSINKRFTILNFFRPLLKNMFVSCHLQSEGGSLCCLVGVFFLCLTTEYCWQQWKIKFRIVKSLLTDLYCKYVYLLTY